LKPPEKGKLDGVVLLGFAEKKSSSKVEMVDFWTFWLKTTSKQVAPPNSHVHARAVARFEALKVFY